MDNIVNCWNSIGVWGKQRPRCPVLESVIHCHNCEKYILSGQQVLAREIKNIEELRDGDEELLKYSEIRPESSKKDAESIMVLRIEDEWFAIPSNLCILVSEKKAIHSLPHQKLDYIKGVVNISGEVQLCFSLRSLLGVKESKENRADNHHGLYNCLIVIAVEGKRYVFPVSEFRGLHKYNKSELIKIPATIHKDTAKYLIGVLNWNSLNVGCIDANLLFSALERKIQ